MKKITLLMLSVWAVFASCTPENNPGGDNSNKPIVLTEMPFTKGVNISDWFLQVKESYLTKEKYSEKDFKDIVSLGFEAIRLPIGFHHFTGPGPAYDLSDNFFEILDYAVDLAEKHGLYIILDNHTYFGSDVFPPSYGEAQLIRVWEQMAAHYKNRSELVIYEVMNEPGGSYMEQHWYDMQTRFLQTIRAIDTKHTIIVKGVGDDRGRLSEIPVYEDKNLIYSFHFYATHLFTHQKPSWDMGSPTHDLTSPVPFPFDAARMPEKPASFAGTEFEDYYDNYAVYGTAAYIKQCIDEAGNFGFERNVPVFCGEFGVLNNGFADSKDRANWHQACVNAFALNQIGWTIWDYNTDFSMFDGSPIFEQNLNVDLLKALGLKVPTSYESGKAPELQIYDDVLANYAKNTSWNGDESENNSYYAVNYEHKDRPFEGLNCIEWSIPSLEENKTTYCSLQFTFWPVADFSKQFDSDYSLEFMIRCDQPVDNLFVRFQYWNSDRGNDHRAWRNVYILGNNSPFASGVFASNGSWNKVSIPMKSFYIKGNNDRNPWVEEGEYDDYVAQHPDQTWDWNHINKIEFSTEGNTALKGVKIYIDDVRICGSTK